MSNFSDGLPLIQSSASSSENVSNVLTFALIYYQLNLPSGTKHLIIFDKHNIRKSGFDVIRFITNWWNSSIISTSRLIHLTLSRLCTSRMWSFVISDTLSIDSDTILRSSSSYKRRKHDEITLTMRNMSQYEWEWMNYLEFGLGQFINKILVALDVGIVD